MYTHTPTYERISEAQTAKTPRERSLYGFIAQLEFGECPALEFETTPPLEVAGSTSDGTIRTTGDGLEAGGFA